MAVVVEEIVRASVCALSRKDETTARPVHIGRIRAFCSRYGVGSDDVMEGLRTIALLKEVLRLPNGYWLPAPFRTVFIGNRCALLSPETTARLAQFYPIARTFGHLRCSSVAVTELPNEPFSEWVNAPTETKKWAQVILRDAEASKQTLVGTISGSYWGYVDTRTRSAWSWRQAVIPTDLPLDGMWHLCQSTKPRFPFLARRLSKTDSREASCRNSDVRRLQFALAALNNRPIRGILAHSRNSITLHIPLPREERRLLAALAQNEINGARAIYTIAPCDSSAICNVLDRLGITMEER